MTKPSVTLRSTLIACVVALAGLASGAASAAETDTTPSKTPTKAELGVMLKACSDEADAKGLTVQKGKGEQRKAYRRACMMKKGVAPKSK